MNKSLLPYLFLIIVILTLFFTGIVENAVDLLLNNNLRYEYVIIFLIIFSLAQILRALRLKLLLNIREISITYFIKMIYLSWFMNVIFPARLGEVSQIYMLKKKNISTTKASVTIVLDKIVDLLTLMMLLIVLLNIVKFNHTIASDLNFELFYFLSSFICGMIFFSLYLAYGYPEFLKSMVSKLLPENKFTFRVLKLIDNVSLSLKELVANPSRFVYIFLLSFGVWLLEMTSIYIIALSLNISLQPDIAFLAQIITFGSMIIPLTPGGFGTYEATSGFVLASLTDHDLSDTTLPLATIEHTLRQTYSIIAGSIALYSVDRSEFKQYIRNSKNQNDNGSEPKNI